MSYQLRTCRKLCSIRLSSSEDMDDYVTRLFHTHVMNSVYARTHWMEVLFLIVLHNRLYLQDYYKPNKIPNKC